MTRLISDGYRDQLREMSDHGVWAGGGHNYADEVYRLCRKVKGRTVLDYGCGPGTLKPALPSLKVYEYDPGVPGKDGEPEPADIVACLDVLEHIEPDCLAAVIDHICGLTLKACIAVIALRPAEKRLPDGRNAHLIIDNAPWWRQQLMRPQWSIAVKAIDSDGATFWMRRVAGQ